MESGVTLTPIFDSWFIFDRDSETKLGSRIDDVPAGVFSVHDS